MRLITLGSTLVVVCLLLSTCCAIKWCDVVASPSNGKEMRRELEGLTETLGAPVDTLDVTKDVSVKSPATFYAAVEKLVQRVQCDVIYIRTGGTVNGMTVVLPDGSKPSAIRLSWNGQDKVGNPKKPIWDSFSKPFATSACMCDLQPSVKVHLCMRGANSPMHGFAPSKGGHVKRFGWLSLRGLKKEGKSDYSTWLEKIQDGAWPLKRALIADIERYIAATKSVACFFILRPNGTYSPHFYNPVKKRFSHATTGECSNRITDPISDEEFERNLLAYHGHGVPKTDDVVEEEGKK